MRIHKLSDLTALSRTDLVGRPEVKPRIDPGIDDFFHTFGQHVSETIELVMN